MKELRFLHTADWHADSDPIKQEKLEASLKQIVDYCREIKVNAIIHAGDVWERSQRFQINSGVPVVIKYLRELSKLVDFIFITKGNNSHDEPGSISLLHQIEPNIYAYEYPISVGIWQNNIFCDPDPPEYSAIDLLRTKANVPKQFNYIVTLVPYPTKASLLIDDSIDNNNVSFIEKFEQIFEHIGEVTQSYTCPKILAFHGNVVGSRLSTGQTLISQDIMVASSTLERALHDYYALGHIHLRQFIKPNMGYSGSIYNKNWGETEQKSFEVIEFDGKNTPPNSCQIPLTSARPMITIEAEFTNGEFVWDKSLLNNNNGEFRFRCKVKENERNLITYDKIDLLKSLFGQDVKIEFNIIPVERESRSEKIMNCKTLLDEVEEYSMVTEGQNLSESIKQKILSIMNERVIV